MKKAVFITAVLASVICITAACGQASSGPDGRQPAMSCPAMAIMLPPAGAIDRAVEKLGLTEDQVTRLKTAMACDESISSLSQKAADATKALRDALAASDYDAQKVKDLAAIAEKAEAAVISARIDEWTQLRSILTADQAKKLQEMSSMQRPSRGQRPDGLPPGGGGFPGFPR